MTEEEEMRAEWKAERKRQPIKVYQCDHCQGFHTLADTVDCVRDACSGFAQPPNTELIELCCDCAEDEGLVFDDHIGGMDPLCDRCREGRLARMIDAAADRMADR